ncbi:hypothetical protein B0H17DRAFT_199513 [Mycena rosella]|uniref:GATA-type domain-containing protein n=1 Tax=Mycena rosella TaxID=1033263 RepID=A0AAD7DWX8_MYCRO|nr:hypothetical protein B0H17DRAFT_199513 [Mycena rosella]
MTTLSSTLISSPPSSAIASVEYTEVHRQRCGALQRSGAPPLLQLLHDRVPHAKGEVNVAPLEAVSGKSEGTLKRMRPAQPRAGLGPRRAFRRRLVSPPGHPTPSNPGPSKSVEYKDNAGAPFSACVRRRCFNCGTIEFPEAIGTDSAPRTWHASNLTPGKLLCQECGAFENVCNRPHPLVTRYPPMYRLLHNGDAGPERNTDQGPSAQPSSQTSPRPSPQPDPDRDTDKDTDTDDDFPPLGSFFTARPSRTAYRPSPEPNVAPEKGKEKGAS